ncbi:MAG: triose-phosphate isomerase [Flavobacteriaceae bacterium]|nr:triose-phosphate isomerase [Flavobacteriaceae bacterium]
MRKKIVAGNWKMNLNKEASLALVNGISDGLPGLSDMVRVIVAPPFVNIPYIQDASNRNARVEVAAQNMHFAESGAYTGEVAADMLQAIGINTVILGHSERREYFKEDAHLLTKKVEQALEHKMEVIFCFGEKLEDRQGGNHFDIVREQLSDSLFHLNDVDWDNIILAYEPVWAIGTGETASPEQAQEMHAFIRNLIEQHYDDEVADRVSILYGGSVKPANAKEIFSKPDVDGGLIGGASLKTEDFLAIINSI